MLPKPEKNKKTPTDQTELTESLSAEARIKKKRFLILLFLGLSVGLSICFSAYGSIKRNLSSPITVPKFSFNPAWPKIDFSNLSFKDEPNLNALIKKNIANQAEDWKIYVRVSKNDSAEELLVYPTGIEEIDLDQIEKQLDQKELTSNSSISQNLPPGVYVKENIIDNPKELQELILVPKMKILMVFKVPASANETAKVIIPKLVEDIYWQLMQH